MMNSFLLLQEQEQQFFVKNCEEDVRDAVESRLKTVYLISDILEHFFPMLSDTLTVMAGGNTINPEDAYLTFDEDETARPTPRAPEGE
jgi:hypothetical protein